MSIPTPPTTAPIQQGGPPPQVRTAFRLYVASIGLAAIGLALSLLIAPRLARVLARQQHLAGAAGTRSVAELGLTIGVVVGLVLLGVELLVIFRMRGGRNWARVLLTVLSLLGLVLLVVQIGQLGSQFSAGPVGVISALLHVVGVVLLVVATWFMFRPDAARYFRASRAPRA